MKLRAGLGLIAILLSSGGCVPPARNLDLIPEPECDKYNPNLYSPDSPVVDDMNSILCRYSKNGPGGI